ncbi:hypothetical protein ABFY57_11980 [Paenibacillus polymyxa]|uniref:hypothetical protein n=1 Tax=Paenibacillus polymyxa TaxID=1406 RepID=UPI003D28EFAC
MKYKSIRKMITEEAWNKMKDKMSEAFIDASKRLEGSIVDEGELGLTLGCDFVSYYQIPIVHIAEVLQNQYPFIKKKSVEFQPWLSDPDGRGSSCEISISDFKVESKMDLTETQEEIVDLISKELIEIYDEFGLEITAYTEELTDEEQEEHGEGYVRVIEIA